MEITLHQTNNLNPYAPDQKWVFEARFPWTFGTHISQEYPDFAACLTAAHNYMDLEVEKRKRDEAEYLATIDRIRED